MNFKYINLKNVSVRFNSKNPKDQSFKHFIADSLIGGKLLKTNQNSSSFTIDALKDINLTINSGDKIGIVGHNGAGKTTLLRVLSGIYSPSIGSVNIQGKVTSLLNIGLGINPDESGLENIKLRGLICGMSIDEIESSMDDIVNFSGLGDFIYLPFRSYSSGMQMRLAFAVATATYPEILILDEWLSLGDNNFQKKSFERMQSFTAKSDILILASHSRDALINNCNRIIWLEGGKIKADGPCEDLLNKYFKQ